MINLSSGSSCSKYYYEFVAYETSKIVVKSELVEAIPVISNELRRDHEETLREHREAMWSVK